jgi:beta-galactosidase GanA
MNLNTVLAPVYWELLEPREGAFDFKLVDDLITSARRQSYETGVALVRHLEKQHVLLCACLG